MSTPSKLNPKSLAKKKSLHCRLGLTKKRYLPPAQIVTSNGNRNAEWSVTVSPLQPPNRSRNMGEEIIFNMFKTRNPVRYQASRESTLNLKPSVPAQKLRSGNNQFRFEAIHYYASSRISRLVTRSTISQHIANLYLFYDYLAKKDEPPPSIGAVDEGDL